jgi:hypothetical protein
LITPPGSLRRRPGGFARTVVWGGPLVGRSLLAGLVWPVPIVMIGVLAED